MKESPIVNEANEPVIIHEANSLYDEDPATCGCSSFVPAGARSLFFKFSIAALAIGGGVMYGLWKLMEWLA